MSSKYLYHSLIDNHAYSYMEAQNVSDKEKMIAIAHCQRFSASRIPRMLAVKVACILIKQVVNIPFGCGDLLSKLKLNLV